MSVRDLIPWGRQSRSPATYRESDPFLSLHREMNRLFDDVFRGFDSGVPAMGAASWLSGTWPSVEITETEKEFRLTAEVPGLEEKDIEILLEDGVLTLRGEKRSETEDKDRHFSERRYGRFERRFSVGAAIDNDKVSAAFRNGVLSVTLPKTAVVETKAKRIAIAH